MTPRATQLAEAAREYHDNHHWVPLRLDGKAAGKGWTKRTLDHPIPVFTDDNNVGILLGEPSGNLVRLDADYPAIPTVTGMLFPEPTLTFGRASSPQSGRLVTSIIENTNFKLPESMTGDPRLPPHDGEPSRMVFQIMSTGSQVMVPPSIHPDSGEELVWQSELPPASIDESELVRRVGIEAFLMAVRQFWPSRPSRNEAAMALARVLLEVLETHHPDDADRCAIVDNLVEATAVAGGDGEKSRKGKARATATLKKMRAGKQTTGMTRLVKLLELPEDVATEFWEWLGGRHDGKAQYELNVLHGADLVPMQLRWMWPGRIPLGTFVTLIGVPAAGKSNVYIDISARVTTGRDMPPTNARITNPADVLLFCTEDQPEQTIIPRLLAMGGDKSRLHIVTSMKSSDGERGFDLTQDVTVVEHHLEAHPEIELVIFDPISEFLGSKINSHNNTEVRAALGPLMKILHRRQIACICVSHVAKTKAQDVQSAALGSQAFSAAPRGSMMVTDEMEDVEQDDGNTKREPTGRKLLSVNMGNLAPPDEMKTLAFRIMNETLLLPDSSEIEKISCVRWDGEVEITARQIHEEAKPKSKEAVARDKAVKFIMREMADPNNPGEWRVRLATEMNALADAEGVAERTLDRARDRLHVVAKQGKTLGMPGRGDVWWWVREERRF